MSRACVWVPLVSGRHIRYDHVSCLDMWFICHGWCRAGNFGDGDGDIFVRHTYRDSRSTGSTTLAGPALNDECGGAGPFPVGWMQTAGLSDLPLHDAPCTRLPVSNRDLLPLPSVPDTDGAEGVRPLQLPVPHSLSRFETTRQQLVAAGTPTTCVPSPPLPHTRAQQMALRVLDPVRLLRTTRPPQPTTTGIRSPIQHPHHVFPPPPCSRHRWR